MRLCGKMDDSIDLFILHQLIESLKITDIHLYKLVVRLILNIFEISQITCICKLIKVDDIVFRIFVDKESYNVTAYESCTTGDDNISSVSCCVCGIDVLRVFLRN